MLPPRRETTQRLRAESAALRALAKECVRVSRAQRAKAMKLLLETYNRQIVREGLADTARRHGMPFAPVVEPDRKN